MPINPHLVIQSGEDEERIEEIESDRVEIGRDDYCDISLDEPRSSRTHCAVEKTPDGWQVVDLESRNGTKVNGEYTNKQLLEDEDVIGVGDTEIEFRTSAPSDATGGPGISRPDKSPDAGPSSDLDPDQTPPADGDSSEDKKQEASDRKVERDRPEGPLAEGPTGDRARPALSRGKAGAERGKGSAVPDTKVEDQGPTIRIWFWTILGALIVAQLLVFAIVQYRRQQRVKSRSAYREANEDFLNGRYKQAIESYGNVESSTPDLYDRARGRMQRAREAMATRKRLKKMYRLEERFYKFLDRLESGPLTAQKLNREFADFKEDVKSSAEGDLGGRLSTFLKEIDRTRRRMESSISTSEDGRSRLKWSKLKANVEEMRNQEKFGPAVNRLLEFQFITDRDEYSQKAEELISDLVAAAKLRISRRIATFRNMLNNGRAREALKQSAAAMREVRSYHPVLHRLSLNLYDLRQNIRKKLDSNEN